MADRSDIAGKDRRDREREDRVSGSERAADYSSNRGDWGAQGNWGRYGNRADYDREDDWRENRPADWGSDRSGFGGDRIRESK